VYVFLGILWQRQGPSSIGIMLFAARIWLSIGLLVLGVKDSHGGGRCSTPKWAPGA
jgi:hypothetical protein